MIAWIISFASDGFLYNLKGKWHGTFCVLFFYFLFSWISVSSYQFKNMLHWLLSWAFWEIILYPEKNYLHLKCLLVLLFSKKADKDKKGRRNMDGIFCGNVVRNILSTNYAKIVLKFTHRHSSIFNQCFGPRLPPDDHAHISLSVVSLCRIWRI